MCPVQPPTICKPLWKAHFTPTRNPTSTGLTAGTQLTFSEHFHTDIPNRGFLKEIFEMGNRIRRETTMYTGHGTRRTEEKAIENLHVTKNIRITKLEKVLLVL
jgi:hypothetical protein